MTAATPRTAFPVVAPEAAAEPPGALPLTVPTFGASGVYMDTPVSIEVVAPAASVCEAAVARAFGWFEEVEARCSRFDQDSEISALSRWVGVPVAVSPLVFRVVEFALAVARDSGGAFDPTLGHAMEARGFDHNYRTGRRVSARVDAGAGSWRDVELDPARRAITLRRPLVLDLGAVAKGFAIDLAAAELRSFAGFAINAGGDLYVAGTPGDRPWRVGVRHPRDPGALAATLLVSDAAVCTSGDYERLDPAGSDGHHLLDPATGDAARDVASVTVVAPAAMLADALGTAAFVMGPRQGLAFLSRNGVEGLIVSADLARHSTAGFSRYEQ